MADPFGTGIVFAFLNSAYRLSEHAIKFHSVESENGVFVRMIQQVRLDVEETERLLCIPSVKAMLISTPGKLPWIRNTIISAKTALNEIGRWVERVRIEKEGHGKVSWESRVRWVFNDYEKILNRRMELSTSHQALSNVLAYLAPLEQADTPEDPSPPLYDNATFFDDFLSPRQKKKVRDMKRRLGEEKKDNGTVSYIYGSMSGNSDTDICILESFEEGVCQSVQVPIPVFSVSPSIPRKEEGSGRHVELLGDTDSSQTSSLTIPSPWSTPGTRSIPSRPPISPRPLDPPSNWPFPQVPPPVFQPPGSQTSQSFTGTKTYPSSIYPRNIASRQPVHELPLVSGTNFLGPLDPFELLASSDSQTSSIRSKNMHPVLSGPSFSTHRPLSLQNPPNPSKTPQSLAETGPIAEIIGDLSMPHSETHISLEEIPKNISLVQSSPTNLPRALQVGVPPRLEIPISQSTIPSDAINRRATWPAPAIDVLEEPYYSVKRPQKPHQFSADAPILTCAEMLSDGVLQVPQAHQQHPPSMASWPSIQLRTQSQLQQEYQSQNQPRHRPTLTAVSHPSFLNPILTTALSSTSWQEQQYQQVDHSSGSRPMQGATVVPAAQPGTSLVEQECSALRSTTLREARRRNRKALLDLMRREGLGG